MSHSLHPGLPGVLRRFESALLYPRSNPWNIISGGLLPIQAYLGYYDASKQRSSTPGPIHEISWDRNNQDGGWSCKPCVDVLYLVEKLFSDDLLVIVVCFLLTK
jgi:hypothetical protein